MKTNLIKKTIAASLSGLMMFAVSIPMAMQNVYAADQSYTISIDSSDSRTYAAYKVFDGDLSIEGSSKVLANIKWANETAGNSILNDIKSNTSLSSLSSCESAADVAEKLATVTDDETLDIFAGIVAKHISDLTRIEINSSTSPSVDAGYYLIIDETVVESDSAGSRFILEVAGNTEITPKVALPTIDKKIGTSWDLAADANTASLNGTVDYILRSVVPDMTGYNKYFYVVEDTLSAGLTLKNDSFVITVGDDTLTNVTGSADASLSTGKTYYVDGSGQNIKIVFNNFKQYSKDLVIEVRYQATVNASAVIGTTPEDSNTNTVKLNYSNDPNYEYVGQSGKPSEPGDGEPVGKTNEEVVYTYAAKLQMVKVDGSDNTTKLKGAKFELYDESGAIVLGNATSDTNGIAVFNTLLGTGTYKIKEIQAPAGYNLPKEEYTLVIGADPSETGCIWSENGSTENIFTVDGAMFSATIANNKGTTLPGTGGIGTTIFYVFGGILVLGAVIVLITKKRMSLKNDK